MQRVHFLALEGFCNNSGDIVDQTGTEAFLRCCREKEDARYVIERNPWTINEALKWIKASMANHRVIFGSRSPVPLARNYFSHRQVAFADTLRPERSPSPVKGPKATEVSDAQDRELRSDIWSQ